MRANVIGIIENQAPTRRLILEVDVQDGELRADPGRDLAKLAVIERHHGTGQVALGLVTGFGLQGRCAIASTVAHDSHNLVVLGTDDEQMAFAVNKLAEVGGGQIVVREGEVIGLIELPIAGLMSNEARRCGGAQSQDHFRWLPRLRLLGQ